MTSVFTHLHTHTEYTRGNSTLSIDDLVRRAKEFGMEATAIVDSGTIAGFEAFAAACAEHGVRPIYGCGFYLAQGSRLAPEGRSHLVLLAYNEPGMQNLRKLDALAQSEGWHGGKAHIDDGLLAQYNGGLICLTGGLGGDIDKLLVAGAFDAALKRAEFYHGIFGDHFYLELQDHGSDKNRVAMAGLRKLSEQTGIPLMVSQGAFYLDPSDAEACNRLREENGNKPLKGDCYHFRSAEEMNALFKAYPAALANTARIAAQCLQ